MVKLRSIVNHEMQKKYACVIMFGKIKHMLVRHR